MLSEEKPREKNQMEAGQWALLESITIRPVHSHACAGIQGGLAPGLSWYTD